MKILFTAKGEEWDSQLDPHFGRATGFLLYDTASNEKLWISNEENIQAAHGAGIQAAQNAADMGANVLITGRVGPKAKSTLDNTGIQIFTVNTPCTLKEAYNRFLDSNE
ncbi:MAG: NifB/NifX family molybdenum-iron cluster-binding protein [Bacteroidales bacterium]